MDFTIETTDMDLGDTAVENIFINDYMPMANGTYVKVYLLGYKYAQDKDSEIRVNNETIAKHLDIPLTDVLNAWNFWEEKGIIKKEDKDSENKFDYKVEFLNLKQLYINNNYKTINNMEKVSEKAYVSTSSDLLEANNMEAVNKMFNAINYIIRRQLVPNEKKMILEWFHNYNMNPDIIEKAFFYSVEKRGKRSVSYVGGIIKNWYDQGITNIEALQEHFKKNDEKYYRYGRVMRFLGRASSNPTEPDAKTIDKWFNEYGFDMEMVLKACETSKNVANPTVNYIDGTMSSWYEKGIKTPEDIETKDQKPERKEYKNTNKKFNTSNKRPQATKTRFHNFDQRTSSYSEEQLEAIARRKREEYYLKKKGENK